VRSKRSRNQNEIAGLYNDAQSESEKHPARIARKCALPKAINRTFSVSNHED
jgi:hypothetical protein